MSHETVNKQLVSKWIEALTSGEYEQGKHVLRSINNKYCCLGVLADIAIKMGVIEGSWEEGYIELSEGEVDCYSLRVGKQRPSIAGSLSTESQELPYTLLPELGFRMDGSGGLYARAGEPTRMISFTTSDNPRRKAVSLAAANDTGVPFHSIANAISEIFKDVLEEGENE